MRLMNVDSFKLKIFPDKTIPEYVILSHTWGDEDKEVSFEDMKDLDRAKQKAAWYKIKFCAEQARNDGWSWAWVDTCCIDKSSSSELSEAINSMYQWYERSMVCYVYLSDVDTSSDQEIYRGKLRGGTQKPEHDTEEPDSAAKRLRGKKRMLSCRWFKRGWTLQELVAPLVVEFYDGDWVYLGSKEDMADQICEITGIPPKCLTHERGLTDIPVATKMHWAHRRSTTRAEDMAYSLMGIFGVNMPLLYGEGKKSFQRLALEILQTTDDHSIFLWGCQRRNGYSLTSQQELSSQPDMSHMNLAVWRIQSMLPSDPSDFEHAIFEPPRLTTVNSNIQGIDSQGGIRIRLPLKLLTADYLDTNPQLKQLTTKLQSKESPTQFYFGRMKCLTNPEGNEEKTESIAILLGYQEKRGAFHRFGPGFFLCNDIPGPWEVQDCSIPGTEPNLRMEMKTPRLVHRNCLDYSYSGHSWYTQFIDSHNDTFLLQTYILSSRTLPRVALHIRVFAEFEGGRKALATVAQARHLESEAHDTNSRARLAHERIISQMKDPLPWQKIHNRLGPVLELTEIIQRGSRTLDFNVILVRKEDSGADVYRPFVRISERDT